MAGIEIKKAELGFGPHLDIRQLIQLPRRGNYIQKLENTYRASDRVNKFYKE